MSQVYLYLYLGLSSCFGSFCVVEAPFFASTSHVPYEYNIYSVHISCCVSYGVRRRARAAAGSGFVFVVVPFAASTAPAPWFADMHSVRVSCRVRVCVCGGGGG